MRRLLLALLVSGCCFDPLGLTPPIVAPGGTGTPVATGGPHMPGGAGSSIFGVVRIASGFAPDPTIVSALAGGPSPISSFASGCAGHASPTPSHHLTIEGDVALHLRLMAWAPAGDDLTIAVRGADGRVRCNDDSDGLMPMVEDTFGPGEYDVWVGTYAAGRSGVPYDLGVTTNLAVTPTSLHAPPPPLPAYGYDPLPVPPPG